MRGILMIKTWLFLAAVLLPVMALGQWPTDAEDDMFLADGSTEQVVPHVAATSDGGCYVGWYDNLSLGVYHVRLQRLSPAGVELWGHGGILISDHPSDSWIMDWDLIADGQDNAVLVFNDLRSGEFDPQIYKIDPDGNFLWGPDGISLTSNTKVPGFPRLAEATDGDLVVVWPEGEMTNKIMMQRLSPSGELRLAEGGIEIAGENGKWPFGADVVPTPDNGIIVAWIPDSDFDEDRHLAAQKFSADGSPVWADPVAVFDGGNIPIGTYYDMLPDGLGGAVFAWTWEDNLYFTTMAQHLTGDGTEMWPHDGVVVFPGSLFQHIYPTLTYDSATGESSIFSRSQTTSQGQWGLDGQKLASDGSLLWGDSGRQYLPVNYDWVSIPLCVPVPSGGAMVVFLTHTSGSIGLDRLDCLRVDEFGKLIWSEEIMTMASTLSDKLFMSFYMGNDGAARAVWQDKRFDAGDILAKSINQDGSLGMGPSPVFPPAADRGVKVNIFPNPFNPQTVISFTLDRAQQVTINVCDLRGRRLAQLADQNFAEGTNKITWSGTDASGHSLASGSYVVQLLGEGFTRMQTVTLVR